MPVGQASCRPGALNTREALVKRCPTALLAYRATATLLVLVKLPLKVLRRQYAPMGLGSSMAGTWPRGLMVVLKGAERVSPLWMNTGTTSTGSPFILDIQCLRIGSVLQGEGATRTWRAVRKRL